MEITEQVYEGGTYSKTTTISDTNHVSHGRKHKGEEAALPTNPKKVRSGKRKKNHAGHLSDRTTAKKHDWCMDPGTP